MLAAMVLCNALHERNTDQKPTGNNIVSWSDAAINMPRLSMHSDPVK